MSKGWHILRDDHDGGVLTLTRHLPARFDLSAQTELPLADPLRLAHQIRQDLWRALQNLRGFSPVIRIETTPDHLRVVAGGRVLAPIPGDAVARISAVLDNPAKRARWIMHARRAATRWERQT